MLFSQYAIQQSAFVILHAFRNRIIVRAIHCLEDGLDGSLLIMMNFSFFLN